MNQTPTTVLVFTLAFGGAMVLSDADARHTATRR